MSPRPPEGAFTVRPLRPDEAEAGVRRGVESFGQRGDGDPVEQWRRRAADGELWGVEAGGVVLAHCRALASRHWFGGRLVPCQHITAVAVAPEHRGKGAARALMEAMVRQGHAQGLGLSVLFPATTTLYRRMGWEHAGDFHRAEVDTRVVPPVGPALERLDEPDWAAVQACHDAFARALEGPAERPQQRWDDLRERATFVYGLADQSAVEAYALVRHQHDPGEWRYTLVLEDWAATTPRGLEAVLGFIGRHGTIAGRAVIAGPAVALLSLHLPEQDWTAVTNFHWMARPLDVAALIGSRGFATHLRAEVELEVVDPLLPQTRGPWRLSVADGAGQLEPAPGAPSPVRLDVRAVGPLVTGFQPAERLTLGGLISGDADQLAALTAVFAGASPLLLDFF